MKDVVIIDYIDRLSPAFDDMSKAIQAAAASLGALSMGMQDDVKVGDFVMLPGNSLLYRVVTPSGWHREYILERVDSKYYNLRRRRGQFRVVTPLEALGRATI